MGRILILLCLFSGAAQAAVPSGVPSFTVGASSVIPAGTGSISPLDLSASGGWFTISAGDENVALAASDFYPFYGVPPGSSIGITNTAYRVSAGKTAYCFGFVDVSNGTGMNWQLVSDINPITFAQSTALISGRFQAGVAAKYPNQGPLVAATPITFPGLTWVFRENTYPGIQVSSSSDAMGLTATCYEK